MTFRQTIILLMVCAALSWSCDNQDPVETTVPPFVEAVAETIVFTEAQAIYFGDDGNTGVSDMWYIRLYTDMEQDMSGNPVGPGQLMQISCNTPQETGITTDCLEGVYIEPSGIYDYSSGTFNPGYMISIDLPDGKIETPAMSYFADITDGSTDFTPELLREGHIIVDINKDGTYTIEGTLTGQTFRKRNFTYTGPLESIDESSARTMKKVLRRR